LAATVSTGTEQQVPEFVDKRLAAGIAVVLLGLSTAAVAAAHADEPTW
jgi:glycerol dehydrogenase-like iron-containing ADH family enzyme